MLRATRQLSLRYGTHRRSVSRFCSPPDCHGAAALLVSWSMACAPALPLPRDVRETSIRRTKPIPGEADRMEQAGLQQVFSSARAELLRFLQARGLSREDAEDLLQDLYVKIETSTLPPVSEPKAYLYSMANNLAHDRRRSEQSRKRRDGAWLSEQNGSPGDMERSWDPDAVLQARDHLRRVEAALDGLPERTSSVFRRYRIEGESQKAIAASLGISLSAVEKHLQRAYRTVLDLKRRLDRPSGKTATDFEEGGRDARS